MTKEKANLSVNYNKLWKMLIDRNMTKTQMRLAVGLSTVTLAKLNKGKKVRSVITDRICETFHCKQEDIMEVAGHDAPSKRRSGK